MSHRGMFVLAAILACNLRMALGEPITPPPIASEAPREAAIPAAGSFPPAATVLARFPVAFEVNEGQYDPAVRYLARASGYRVVLSDAGATFCLPSATRDQDSPGPGVVQLRFVNGNRAPVVRPSQPLHRTNYFIGENPAQFHTDIENFAQVLYTEIYANVDVLFYGNSGRVEYDLILKPGADVSAIELEFVGAKEARVDAAGDLIVETAQGTITQHQPAVYQEIAGKRRAIAATYQSIGTNRFKFNVAQFDPARRLIIDPVLSYSTYLGGASAEAGQAIAVDAAGNVYITGSTSSSNYPTLGAYQGSRAGTTDVFVTKLNAAGTGIVYSTYIGGRSSVSSATGIAVDSSGSAYITGTTTSNSYPTTAGALQGPVSGGGGFVTKLNAAGNALTYSTYLKGAFPQAIGVDSGGNALVAGYSLGSLTTTTGAFRTSKPSVTPNHSGFVAKLNATGSSQQYSTYLGGTSSDDIKALAIDTSGNAYVVGATTSIDFPVSNPYQGTSKGGKDAFVTKLNSSGTGLLFSTYLGGSADDSANAVAVDAGGNVYVAGDTFSTDFPRFGGRAKGHNDTVANNAFITKLGPTGNTLVASTYFGGAACLTPTVPSCTPTQPNDGATAIAVDPTGTYVYVAGYLSSVIVALADPIQGALNGPTDAFVAKLTMPFFLYATRIGGSDIDVANGIALDGSGNAYVVGTSNGGTNFPTTLGAAKLATGGGSDAFVAKLATPGVRLQVLLQASPPNTYQMTGLLDPSVNSGTVTFFDGATALAQESVVGGIATFTTVLAIGIHEITAVYSGNGLPSDTAIFVIPQQ